jgi:hypothetical protein
MFVWTSAPRAESPANAFKKDWTGRHVVVQRTLFTLVYDEMVRFGRIDSDKRDGLMVVTPSKGSYLRFTARQSQEDDITDVDPDRLMDRVKSTYNRTRLRDEGLFQTVTPLHVVRYPRGVSLVVNRVRLERMAVTLHLHKLEPNEFATTLTVQWPAPLSKELDERQPLEHLIQQFIVPRTAN